mmetsp:Transcript_11132/g.26420  ORF Transcript_11132/g.26420 Transcript_11132/m.26420 type:complete len:367 (-) Transcript_11132:513-1613(-)
MHLQAEAVDERELPVGGPERELVDLEERAAGQERLHGDILQLYVAVGGRGGCRKVHRVERGRSNDVRLLTACLKGLHKLSEPVDDGGKSGKRLELEDDERHVAEDVAEGRGALVHDAKLDLSLEVERGHDGGGEQLDEKPVEGREELQVPARDQEGAVVLHEALDAREQQLLLLRLASVKGDALGVLPDADKAVPEVGLSGLLIEVEPDERPPEVERDDGSTECVARERDEERGVDRKKNAREGDEVHHRVEERKGEAEGRVRELVDVAGDALVGVVDEALGLKLVKGAVGQVFVEVVLRHPLPPLEAEAVHVVVLEHKHGDSHCKPAEVFIQLRVEVLDVLLTEVIEEIAAEEVEQHADCGCPER